jgi:DNA-binding response OmpR family regulator
MIVASEPSPKEPNKTQVEKAEGTNQKIIFEANNKKRVLAVDDNAAMRTFLYDALSFLDYEVVAVGSGADGFGQFIENSFDLVVTDCQMPGMDGWQLAALVKKVSTRTPVIMVTGQDEYAIMDKMQDSDIDYVMFKPFKLDDFYVTVRASLENKLS